MAEIHGMSLDRALALEAATIVDGHIDESGHLILTKHDGTEIDAGYALVATPDASSTVKGIVELAIESEVEAHIDASRAVTPASLASTIARITAVETVADTNRVGKQLNPASYSQTTVLASYPEGISYLYMNDTQAAAGGWDFGSKYGVVVTYRNGSDLAVQTWYYHATGESGSPPAYMWIRAANGPASWSKWSKISTPRMPETMGITGELKMWPKTTAPTGWLICDGSAVSRTTYADLFDVIGTTFGIGDGSTTFTLPNAKGRSPIGYDSSQTEFNAIGKTGGEKTHVLTASEMPSHTHTQDAHSHGTNNFWVSGGAGTLQNGTFYGASPTGSVPSATATNQNTGGDAAHNNLSPYFSINFIIKT